MKKVILAVLMAATKEGILCELTVSVKGNHITTQGSLKIDGPVTESKINLKFWRGGQSSDLTLDTEQNTDLSVSSNDDRYEIGIGGVCISFQEKFQQYPFPVTPSA